MVTRRELPDGEAPELISYRQALHRGCQKF
jgi:hypothetical protein